MNQSTETFVATRKNQEGDITHFKTSSGRELDYDQALAAVESGAVSGVNIGRTKNGHGSIRGNADGNPENNLDNLPSF